MEKLVGSSYSYEIVTSQAGSVEVFQRNQLAMPLTLTTTKIETLD